MRSRVSIAAALWALAAAFAVQAQSWPTQSVKIVVPFSPGTGMDILARTVGPKLAEMWGQPVVVDNRPGASGNLGANLVAKSAPDGYTLVMGASTLVINKTLYTNMPYDPITDLEPIGLAANASLLLVAHPRLGITTAKDLIAQARERPGVLVYGSPGIATPHHMAMELFKDLTGTDLLHIPYKGSAGAVTDLVSGQINLMFLPIHQVLPYRQAGRLKLLAAGGARRHPSAPELPTLVELGIRGAEAADIWYAFYAPKGVPAPVIAKLNAELRSILALAEVRAAVENVGVDVQTSTPDELLALMKRDYARWGEIVRKNHITAQ